MLRSLVLGSVTVLATAGMVFADAKSDVKTAADKITAANDFTFATTVANAAAQGGGGAQGGGRRGGGFGGGPTSGKVDKDLSWLSITGGQGTTEVIFKGDKMVIKGMDGTWQTAEEMAAAAAANGGGRRGGRGGGAAMYATMKNPFATEWANFDKLTNFQSADGAITADAPEDVAKAAATPNFGGGGRRGGAAAGGGAAGGAAGGGIEVTNPKETYKFWVKDGALSKMETHVTGSISFNGNDRPIDRTTDITITDVGSTKIDVPADAQKKLDAPAAAPAQ